MLIGTQSTLPFSIESFENWKIGLGCARPFLSVSGHFATYWGQERGIENMRCLRRSSASSQIAWGDSSAFPGRYTVLEDDGQVEHELCRSSRGVIMPTRWRDDGAILGAIPKCRLRWRFHVTQRDSPTVPRPAPLPMFNFDSARRHSTNHLG